MLEQPGAGVGTFSAGDSEAFEDSFEQIPAFVFVGGGPATGEAGGANAVEVGFGPDPAVVLDGAEDSAGFPGGAGRDGKLHGFLPRLPYRRGAGAFEELSTGKSGPRPADMIPGRCHHDPAYAAQPSAACAQF